MSEDALEIPAQLKNTDAAHYLRQQKRSRFLQLSGLGALGAAGASYCSCVCHHCITMAAMRTPRWPTHGDAKSRARSR